MPTYAAGSDFVERQTVGSTRTVGEVVPVIDIPVGVEFASVVSAGPSETLLQLPHLGAPVAVRLQGKGFDVFRIVSSSI